MSGLKRNSFRRFEAEPCFWCPLCGVPFLYTRPFEITGYFPSFISFLRKVLSHVVLFKKYSLWFTFSPENYVDMLGCNQQWHKGRGKKSWLKLRKEPAESLSHKSNRKDFFCRKSYKVLCKAGFVWMGSCCFLTAKSYKFGQRLEKSFRLEWWIIRRKWDIFGRKIGGFIWSLDLITSATFWQCSQEKIPHILTYEIANKVTWESGAGNNVVYDSYSASEVEPDSRHHYSFFYFTTA